MLPPGGRWTELQRRAAAAFTHPAAARAAEREIAREISDELILKRFLVDPRIIQVSVKDGIATLAGRPETDAVGHRIIDDVRHIRGVVEVRDRLTYSGKNPAIPLPI